MKNLTVITIRLEYFTGLDHNINFLFLAAK